jgi:hypothetical protein
MRLQEITLLSDKDKLGHKTYYVGKARVLADRKRRRDCPYRSTIIVKEKVKLSK